jgi:hypothetical protein
MCLQPLEVPSQHGEGPDHLEEIILACSNGKTREGNSRLSGLQELAHTRLENLDGVHLVWFNEWVSRGRDEPKSATEVLDSFRIWLFIVRRMELFRGF